jgi:predicted N-formylglutamate amidohydrolase
MPGIELILSCEHGGNRLPARYRNLIPAGILDSHRGYDPGALDAARAFAAATGAPLFYSTVSRLLVELNRPLGHHQVFSAYTQRLAGRERDRLLARYYFPYWKAVDGHVRRSLRRGRRVLHLSVHSFTPRLAGVRRTTDVGLLFDPRRPAEASFCRAWRDALVAHSPRLRVRYNDPYEGIYPSIVHALRRGLGDPCYLGVQVEINQRFARGDARRWRRLRAVLAASFRCTSEMMYSTSVS